MRENLFTGSGTPGGLSLRPVLLLTAGGGFSPDPATAQPLRSHRGPNSPGLRRPLPTPLLPEQSRGARALRSSALPRETHPAGSVTADGGQHPHTLKTHFRPRECPARAHRRRSRSVRPVLPTPGTPSRLPQERAYKPWGFHPTPSWTAVNTVTSGNAQRS